MINLRKMAQWYERRKSSGEMFARRRPKVGGGLS
jgi:hypothetical protein